MQEQVTIKLSSQVVWDATTFYRELLQSSDRVKDLLVSYHFRTRGRVSELSFTESSIEFFNPLMGKFVVIYSVGQFNACADVDYSERETMEILFDIDLEKSEALLTGEYIPEREPDEL